jgi:hypothetical protein
MKVILNKEKINDLPIHDAILQSFMFKQNPYGSTCLIFDIKITDNSYDCGFAIPDKEGITKLIFDNCWWFRNEFYCDAKNRDSFFSLDIVKNSAIITELQSRGIPHVLFHYQLEFNSGSKFGIVSEQLSLEA